MSGDIDSNYYSIRLYQTCSMTFVSSKLEGFMFDIMCKQGTECSSARPESHFDVYLIRICASFGLAGMYQIASLFTHC